MTILLLVFGLALMIVGAEFLVRGASGLAFRFGLSPLVVGLTVVAFGTSAPELAVSINSALAGSSGIAVGNVVGSNIFNVLLILGVSATIAPLIISSDLIRKHVPLMVAVSVLMFLMAWDERISRWEGAFLFLTFVTYTTYLIVQSRRDAKDSIEALDAAPEKPASIWKSIVFFLVGLGILVLGAQWLVSSAVEIAKNFGVSESVAGLTIVSIGTSLPELVTSVVASLRGQRELAVGNVVGSNIFNILAVLGIAAIVDPGGMPVSPAVLHFDIPVMVMVAIVCLPIFYTDGLIARWEGVLLWCYYVAYSAYLVMASTQHDSLDVFRAAMIYCVIPLSFLTVIVTVIQAVRDDKGQSKAESMEGDT